MKWLLLLMIFSLPAVADQPRGVFAEVYKTSIIELTIKYRNNELATQREVYGKKVQFNAMVSTVSLGLFNGVNLEFYGGGMAQVEYPDQVDIAAKLHPGDSVMLRCG